MRIIILLALASLLANIAWAVDSQSDSKRYVIPSWGDMTLVYGPGTDPAMDSPQAFEHMIRHWQGRGFMGVHLRTDLAQIEPLIHRNSVTNQNPQLAVGWKLIDHVMESFGKDFHYVAQDLAHRCGFEFWAWHPHVYSDGAPENVGIPGPGRMVPWSYVAKYTYEHPEVITVDRRGNQYWMVREYAYPGARASKIAEFVHMAKNLGIKSFVSCMRSEATQLLPPPDKADQYGFNQPVVEDMKKLYGVDIMTDPRFDVYSDSFDLHDPMVENWRNLRGSYVTLFYRELRQALKDVDPEIRLAVTLSGEYAGPILGNWRMDWRTWVNEGLIDQIVMPVTFEATLDLECQSKGYLTSVRHGKGTVSFQTAHDYIAQSPHPEIEVISTGAPAYFYSPPSAGADGWRCDVWYDAYHLAWFQRWGQLARDVEEMGHIRFLEQGFDDFPLRSSGHAGGWGQWQYVPSLRSSPGCWFKFGTGSDARPTVQAQVHRGDSGQAVRLMCAEDGSGNFSGWHSSSPDRSKYTSCIDVAISNGSCKYDYWLYRDSAESGICAYLQGDIAYETDVGLRISGQTGQLSYRQGDQWVPCAYEAPVRRWQKYTIMVDLDKKVYSAFAGDDQPIMLCRNVKYSLPASRHIEEHGVNVPIEVPIYRIFNYVSFVPEGPAGNIMYLDDVLLQWTPTLYYTKPGEKTALGENFESHPVKDGIESRRTQTGGLWKVLTGSPNSYVIQNSTSYGEGIKCLHSSGGAELASECKIPSKDSSVITVDFDIFIRSDKSYPYILPDPTTTSQHRSTVSLDSDQGGSHVMSLHTGEGTWQYWDKNRYVDSNVPVNYDVWNHVQMARDPAQSGYRIVIQPVGQLPLLIGTAAAGPVAKSDDRAFLRISPSATADHISCYDNIQVAYQETEN